MMQQITKSKLLILFFLLSHFVNAQNPITGKITSESNETLVGATIRILNTDKGTITDQNGYFELVVQPKDSLVVSFIGYENDTVVVYGKSNVQIKLKEDTGQMNVVVVESESTMIDNLEPRHAEVILEKELLKAACCNLSESFETNASVDVSLTDAISGAKMIQMLGLDGRYVQINRENIPLVRGLSSRFGLGYVPGTWIQSIDVGKGAGSVVNGFESMTGQINLEFKKPEINEKLYVNLYTNSFGRAELNYNQSIQLNDKWHAGILTHIDHFNQNIDKNEDGFLDLPKSQQINVLNRYKYTSEQRVFQTGFQYMIDRKAGGQTGFGFDEDASNSSAYGFFNQTKKFELFGKLGLLFPQQPYKGWGFIYSLSHQDIEADFGRTPYQGKESTGYINVINQNIIGTTFHQYKTGFSLLYDQFEESLNDSSFNRTEIVPGAYFEYSYLPNDNFTLVAGQRLDQHNIYGTYFTPRIHARFQQGEATTLRFSAGRGYRTPNVITENMRFLFSSRNLSNTEEIQPEIAWNMGTSWVRNWRIRNRDLRTVFDYFYTHFENQLIVDLDQSSSSILIYNLDGTSHANSFQLEAHYPFNEFFEMKAAYKYYDVVTTLSDRLMDAPFIAKHRFFLNGSYATKFDKWKVDATFNWIGRKRLPDTSDKPTEFQSPNYSPDFILLNGQISRGFKWGSVYLGVENALNFKQPAPIIDAENPFGNNFDGSMVWGPIAGRVIYTGLRYKIK
jgi:outer membrane receptor for ferrienterochelin and colicins